MDPSSSAAIRTPPGLRELGGGVHTHELGSAKVCDGRFGDISPVSHRQFASPRLPLECCAVRALAMRRRQEQRRRTPDTKHRAQTTTHDDEKMLRTHTLAGTKPKTPIGGARGNWAAAPATGPRCPLRARVASLSLPCERGLNSHTVVITRPRLSLAL